MPLIQTQPNSTLTSSQGLFTNLNQAFGKLTD